mmetsp:Transcript_20357/g.66402  ORF Transcript_20357/g.66402 Transcript_20357/m.66402 type:complete len:201 (-) Transcript_20357:18-620(-)
MQPPASARNLGCIPAASLLHPGCISQASAGGCRAATRASKRCSAGDSRVRSPTKLSWTPVASSASASASRTLSISDSSACTSLRGRSQFSCEKAYTDSSRTAPSAAQSPMRRRSASTPAACPSAVGRPRAAAQRLLPSMMTAMCLGTDGSSSKHTASSSGCSGAGSATEALKAAVEARFSGEGDSSGRAIAAVATHSTSQ